MENIQFSSSYSLNTEEDYDDPVEFINEVRVPCLICGTDTQIDNIVKQEIDQFEEGTSNNHNYQLGVDCGSVNHDVFHSFLKWFGFEIKKKGKQSIINKGWDGEGGNILRFCENCKMELKQVLELQKQLDELEKRFKNGLMEVKVKIERLEETFELNGVYEKDQRYKLVRSWILKCETENLGRHTQLFNQASLREQLDDPSSKRRSKRLKTNTYASTSNTETIAIGNDAEVPMERVPTIVVSTPDKANTEQNITPDNSEVNSDHSLDVTVYAKKSKAKQMVRKKVSSGKSPTMKNSIRKAHIPQKFQHTSKPAKRSDSEDSHGQNTAVLADTENRNDSQPMFEKNKSASRPQRRRRKINYAEFILDDDEDKKDSQNHKARGKSQEKVSGQKQVNLVKETVIKTSNSQKSIQKAKKIVQEKVRKRSSARIAKLSKPTAVLAMDTDYASSEDDGDQNPKSNFQTKMTCKVDLSSNTITYGSIKFCILSEPNGKVSCTKCNAIISNRKTGMHYHVIKHHTNKFLCAQCPFRGENKYTLDTHIKSVHQGLSAWKRSECKICGKPILNRKSHEWTHMSKEEQDEIRRNQPEMMPKWIGKKLRCGDCGKCFESQKEVKLHQEKEHEAEKPEKQKEPCPECGKMFAQLTVHMRYYHTIEPRFECIEQDCGKRFVSLSMLTRHKNEVHKSKQWKCAKCSREFASKVNFQNHMDYHMGIRPWKCEAEGCRSAFVTKGDLKQHQKNFHEEGSRPMKMFRKMGPVMLKGFGKPVIWKCPRCTRKFDNHEMFKNHMNMHLGIRPWKCVAEGCGRVFTTKSNLTTHRKRFHEGGCKRLRKRCTRRSQKRSKTEKVKRGT